MTTTQSSIRSMTIPSSPVQQRIIGLTGGVGMGKTTISDYLARNHQIPVLDTDLYAREAVEPGTAVLSEIVARYGSSILLPDGSLDRRRLGSIVFNSFAERHWLEQQIHPFVRDRLIEQLHEFPATQYPIVVLVIPLLFEARMTDLVTEIWVVKSDATQQKDRIMQRDRLNLEQTQARIDSQMSIDKKITHADIVLDNSSTPEHLFQQVVRALQGTD